MTVDMESYAAVRSRGQRHTGQVRTITTRRRHMFSRDDIDTHTSDWLYYITTWKADRVR